MPELPEVETTVRSLRPKILHKVIVRAWTDFEKMIKRPKSFAEFKKVIIGKKIQNIRRRGKNILFDLSDDKTLLIHQKLTGHLLLGKWERREEGWKSMIPGPLTDDKMNGFLHLIFWLNDGWQMALSDVRKFAKVELGDAEEIESELSSLGPDPLKISLEEFKRRLKKKRGKIKHILMSQEVISGIGNIYSDEALFRAKIHPAKNVSELSERDFENLYHSLRDILRKGIRLKGESIIEYRTPTGEKGGFDKLRKVYRKEGEKCPVCGATIQRMMIGGRSAHFCPKCQKL